MDLEKDSLFVIDSLKEEVVEALNNIGNKYGTTATQLINVLTIIIAESRASEYRSTIMKAIDISEESDEDSQAIRPEIVD